MDQTLCPDKASSCGLACQAPKLTGHARRLSTTFTGARKTRRNSSPEGSPEGNPEANPAGNPAGSPEDNPEDNPKGNPEGNSGGTPKQLCVFLHGNGESLNARYLGLDLFREVIEKFKARQMSPLEALRSAPNPLIGRRLPSCPKLWNPTGSVEKEIVFQDPETSGSMSAGG